MVVVGGPGSGKTTTARWLAAQLGVPHVELDSLWWRPRWTPAGADAFSEALAGVVADEAWVLDGNYYDVGAVALAWPVADTLVWLDPPRWLAVLRTVRRSLGRVVEGTELWSTNRQGADVLHPRSLVRLIRQWPSYSDRVRELVEPGDFPTLRVVHVRRRREKRALLGDGNDG